MDAWNNVYSSVTRILRRDRVYRHYFRGHASAAWSLIPGLGRLVAPLGIDADVTPVEEKLYSQFVSEGGELLPEANTSWSTLFTMQHHGLPTRLLDWSESFAIALFFALRDGGETPTIWILNPYDLNEPIFSRPWIPDVADIEHGYDEYFIARKYPFYGDVISLRPTRRHRRLLSQASAFTLHDNLHDSLEFLRPNCTTKIVIPPDAISGAREYLRLAGISEYSLFPDLDGLSRSIKNELHEWGL